MLSLTHDLEKLLMTQSLLDSVIFKTIEEIRKSRLDENQKNALAKLIETTKLSNFDIVENEIYKLAGLSNEDS